MLKSIPLKPTLIISSVCQKVCLHLCLSTQSLLPISDFTACSILCLILPDIFTYKNFYYREQIMKFIIIQSSTAPPTPQYNHSPQRPVHERLKQIFFHCFENQIPHSITHVNKLLK